MRILLDENFPIQLGAHAAELLERAVRGRGFGLVGLVDSVGDLVSSVVVGVLFTVTSPAWGFGYAAVLSAAGALVLTWPPTSRGRPEGAPIVLAQYQASSPGAVWGTLVLIGGALSIAVTEVEVRRPASYGTTTIRPTA